MANITANRDTLAKEITHLDWLPAAAGAKFYKGGIVVANAAGYAVPALTATTVKAAGRSEREVDNTAGAAGDKKVEVRHGIFLYDNSAAGDAITIADRYALCYLVDDHTVAKTDGTGTRSKAGKIVNVEAAGVWVHIDPLVNA
jgi:hypothetical protein